MTAPHPGTGDCFPSPVPAGSGWPGEPATPDTPVARTPAQVRTGARRSLDLAELDAQVSVCRACPRLVDWRERVAVDKRKSYVGEPYWGRPIPGFGAAAARIWILGLAPAAHGANRTGRVFTGDRSGDVLFAALHRAGLVNAVRSEHAGDGLAAAVRVLAAVRCAPPDNAPTPAERAACAPWLSAEWRLAGSAVSVVVALGGFAWRAALDLLRDVGIAVPTPMPRFGHLARVRLGSVTLLGCYHPSQQNTFTGRLTPAMLDDVFAAAVAETAADTIDAADTVDINRAAHVGERTGGSRRCARDATLGSRPRPGP